VRKYSDSADVYTDPKTGVLNNKLGLTTEKGLEKAEAAAFALRSRELARNPIAGNFDLSHLKAIHKKLFSDIYQWAGQVRTVDISKGDSRFAHHGYIEAEAKKLTDQLNREQNLRGLSADRFSQRAGHYMGELNVIHPFREGNGRTLREYMGQIAKEAGYEIKWKGIDRKDMTQASIEAYQGSSERMARLIRENLVDRDRQTHFATGERSAWQTRCRHQGTAARAEVHRCRWRAHDGRHHCLIARLHREQRRQGDGCIGHDRP